VITNRDIERVLVIVAHPDDAEFWRAARSPDGQTRASK
jgi:LmbE family N-acetylglucosaminyl deacetylase